MIAFNALSQLTALGAILVIQTGYMIALARILGPEDFGRFSFVWGITQIMLIGGDLGLHNTALRKISANRRLSLEISSNFFWLKAAASGLLFLVVGAIAIAVRETPETKIALAVFGLGMLLQSLAMGLNVVFQSHGKLYFASLNLLLVFAIQAALGITFALLGIGLVGLALAYLFGVVISTAINCWIFIKEIHPIRFNRGDNWPKFVLESVPVGLSGFFTAASGKLGIALLTVLAGPFQTGVFAAALKIPQALNNIPTAIFSAVLPAMAARQNDPAAVRRLFSRSVVWMIGLSVGISIAFFLLAGPIVGFVYGEEYAESIPNLKLLVWSLIPVFIGSSFNYVLLSQDRLVSRLPWITGTALAVNLVACLILIPRLESRGAALALIVTELVLALGYFAFALPFLSKKIALDQRPAQQLKVNDKRSVAVVVPQFGEDAEGKDARIAASLVRELQSEFEIEVLTTCATSDRDWSNRYLPGEERLGQATIHRFPTSVRRNWRGFGRLSSLIFRMNRWVRLPRFLQWTWLVLQGPYVPELVNYLSLSKERYRAVLFVGYLYYPAVAGLKEVQEKTVLIPIADDDPPLRLPLYKDTFRSAGCILFLDQEEYRVVHGHFDCGTARPVIVQAEQELAEETAGWNGPDLNSLVRESREALKSVMA